MDGRFKPDISVGTTSITTHKNSSSRKRPLAIDSPPKMTRKSSLLNFRANPRNHFIDNDGNTIPLKTGAVIDERKIINRNQIDLACSFDHIPSDRPITVTDYSTKGSPIQGETPGRTKMYRAGSSTFLNFYTNNPTFERSPLRELRNPNFSQTSPYRTVVGNPNEYFTQTIQLDAKQLAKIKAELAETGTSRNQNKVVTRAGENPNSASATRYATAAKLNDNNLSWEWLHQIAFCFLGKTGQVPTNLGCGTAHANTEMLIIEMALPEFVKRNPEGLQLTVTSHYVKSTMILTKIDYILTIDGNEYKAHFNAQRQTQPLKVSVDYYATFFKKISHGIKSHSHEEREILFTDPKGLGMSEPLDLQTLDLDPIRRNGF
jgi:hypothetical protein